MSFYANFAATASKLLTKFGTDIVLTHKSETGSIDPVTGVDTTGAQPTTTVKGIYKKIPSNLIDGTRILSTDKLFVSDDTKKPVMTDTVDGWSIEEIIEVKPATTAIVYFVRLKK